jgi:hypothetical protein
MDVDYRESDHGHWIEPAHAAGAKAWLAETLTLRAVALRRLTGIR